MKNQASEESVLAELYRYHFDVVSPNGISGWAFKLEDEDHSPSIEIRSGNTVLWATEANVYREDLANAGFGNGEYGFSLLPSEASVQAAISSVDLYIDGHKAQESVPFEMEPADKGIYRVHLDHISAGSIRGWAFKEGFISYRSKIEVRSGDVVIAAGLAEGFRQDLLDAGIGDGGYSFSLTPRLAAFPSTEFECCLFVDGEQSSIEPFVLTASEDVIADAVYKSTFSAEITDYSKNLDSSLAALKKEIVEVNQKAGKDEFAVSGQLQVVMGSIAELSARVKVIEQILIKHFSESKR